MGINLADLVSTTTSQINTTTISTAFSTNYQTPLQATDVFAIVMMLTLILVAFQGNLWIIIVITVTPQLRSSLANILVVNLCIVDILASIVTMPLSVHTFVAGNDDTETEVCEAIGFSSTVVMVASMLSMCAISVERFYFISLPMHYSGHATPCLYLLVVIFIWLTSIVSSVLPLVGVTSYSFQPTKRICFYNSHGTTLSDETFVILISVIFFLIPSLIMITMYIAIFCVARKAASTIQPHPRGTITSEVEHQIQISELYTLRNNTQRQSIFAISVHTASDKIVETVSQINMQGLAPSNGSATRTTNECLAQEEAALHQTDLMDSVSFQTLPMNNDNGGKGKNVCKSNFQRKSCLCGQFHSDKVHYKFLCACSKENIYNKAASTVSMPRASMLDSSQGLSSQITEMDAQFGEVSQPPVKVRSSHMKALRTVMIIVASYLLLWGPYFACLVYELVHGEAASEVVELIVTWLCFVSYAINPGLYGLMNRTIREELGHILKCVCSCCFCCGYPREERTCRRPCQRFQENKENEEDSASEAENFYQFLQRT